MNADTLPAPGTIPDGGHATRPTVRAHHDDVPDGHAPAGDDPNRHAVDVTEPARGDRASGLSATWVAPGATETTGVRVR